MTNEQIIEALRQEIKELKAEIEELRSDKIIAETHEDVLKTNYESMCISLPNMAKAERKEAIKEFAERLKDDMRLDEECKYNCISCCYECKEFVPQIDNLVKEMTEVQE